LSSPKRLAFALGVEVGEVKIAVLSVRAEETALELDSCDTASLVASAPNALVEVLAAEVVLLVALPNDITVIEEVVTFEVLAREVSEVPDTGDVDGFTGAVDLVVKNALEAPPLDTWLKIPPELIELEATENEGRDAVVDFGTISTILGFTAATAAVAFSLEAMVENGGVDSLVILPSFFSVVMEVVDLGSVNENPLPIEIVAVGLVNDDPNPVSDLSEVPKFRLLAPELVSVLTADVLKLKLLLVSTPDILVPKLRLLVPSAVVVLVPKLRLPVPPKEDEALVKLNADGGFVEVFSWLDFKSTVLSSVLTGEIASNCKDLEIEGTNGCSVVVEAANVGSFSVVVEAVVES
jgi:hypothetical protein